MPEFLPHNEPETNLPIEAQKLFEFREWGLNGEWLRLVSPDNKSVEGAFYKSGTSNNEMVIFHPGLPGDGIATFEEVFVADLVSAGYDVFAARHNGLKTKLHDSQILLHNTARAEYGGDLSGTALSWFTEPKVAISHFAKQAKPITLITHSFSGITAASSFIDLAKSDGQENPANKVKKWLMPSASIWELGNDGMLDPDRGMDTEKMRQYCEYFATIYGMSEEGGANALMEKLLAALNEISANIGASMPSSTEVIGIYPSEDKLVSPEVGTSFVGRLPRGIIIRDNYSPQHEGEDPHDYKHARSNDLLRIMRMKTSSAKHAFNIN